MNNTKLSMATHIICAIEKFSKSGYDVNSNFLAVSVNTNPASIRRAIGPFLRADIIYTDNGYHINNFKQLSMYDLYKVIEPNHSFLKSHPNGNPNCPVGSKIEPVMTEVYSSFQTAIEQEMKTVKLTEVIENFNENKSTFIV